MHRHLNSSNTTHPRAGQRPVASSDDVRKLKGGAEAKSARPGDGVLSAATEVPSNPEDCGCGNFVPSKRRSPRPLIRGLLQASAKAGRRTRGIHAVASMSDAPAPRIHM